MPVILRAFSVAVIVLLSAAGEHPTAVGGGPERAESRTDALLVRMRDGVSRADSTAVLGGSATYNETLGVWRVPVAEGESLKSALAALGADPRVERVQPNYGYGHAARPNDPLYAEAQAPRMQAINAPAGWEIETGSREVVIAVIDGGVDIVHPELSDRIWLNTAEVPGNGLDDDKNKCVDDVTGCNFTKVPADGDVQDRDGHGTFVAGAAAANTNNGTGIAGVAWNATIMPVRMLDPSGFGDTERLAEAILYAAMNGADVINMSLAMTPSGGSCPDDGIVEEALRAAHDEFGVTLLAAAGNSGTRCVSFPASSEYVIAVGASGPANNPDTRAFFSQWGPEIDVVAPGQDVTSTCPEDPPVPTGFCHGGLYGTSSGTSFSTPMAAGLAALLLSQDASRSPEDVRERMRQTARNMPDGAHPNWDGAGMIDVAAALGSPPAAVFLDVRARNASRVSLALIVGDPGSPLCKARLWDRPANQSSAIHGTFGASECSAFWPPSPERPWQIAGSADERKAARLTGVSVRSGKDSCPATGLPGPIGMHDEVVAAVGCEASGIVANDVIAGASVIPKIPRRFQQDVRYATTMGDPTIACADSYSYSTWFRLPAKAGASRAVAVDTFGSDFDTVLGVFRAGSTGLEPVVCNDDYENGSRVVWVRDGVSDYLIVAGAREQAPPGALTLNVSPAFPPANDARENATAFTGSALQAAHQATRHPSDPGISCASGYGYSVWFSFTSSGGDTAISTAGSTYDTVLAVFRRGGDGSLTEVACSEDVDFLQQTSVATWEAVAGGEYVVLAGAFRDRQSGILRMSFAEFPGP